jgi:hypothetical protein
MRQFDKVAAIAIVLVGFLAGLAILRIWQTPDPPPAHHIWEMDPQGQSENLGSQDCVLAGRIPYYIYPDGITPFYEECLPK